MGRIIILLVIHVFADYIFQGKKMSNLKMLKINSLFQHVLTYTVFLIVLSPIVLGLTFLQGLMFAVVNGVLHLGLDYLTGRFKNHYLSLDENKYLAVIGVDHTLHLIILFSTYALMFPQALSTVSY